jgi:hypothetical protein
MKFYLLAFVCLLTVQLHAQTIIPAVKSYKLENGRVSSNAPKNIAFDTLGTKGFNNKNSFNASLNSLVMNLAPENKSKRVKPLADSLYKAYTDSLYRLELNTQVEELNKSPKVAPVVTGGISNLENPKKSYGSLSFGIQYRLSKYKVTKKNWIDPHYVYLIFSSKTATSPDSSSIQKTFMFPELNKRDFVLGYFWGFEKNDWTIAPTFEFSLNRFIDTGNTKIFISQSFTAGVKVQKALIDEKVNSFVAFYPYYSLITVDRKYATDYQDLTKEVKIPSTFHSLGLHISAQVPNGILFCNMKYILNKEGELKSPDLKRYIYTIGTLLAL